jgi:hypothetical protein
MSIVNVRLLRFAVLATLSILAFQNCGKQFNFIAEQPSAEQISGMGISINSGAPYTRDVAVKLQLISSVAKSMYVTNDPTCASGGTWEPYQTERSWNLAQTNSLAHVFVKYRAFNVDAAMPCLDASIVHDNIAPKLALVSGPQPFQNTSSAINIFSGTDTGSGLERFECQNAAGIWEKCEPTINQSGLAEGNQRAQIRAVDRAGNISDPFDNRWLVDKTRPTITLTKTPPALSNRSSAVFDFEVVDSGSGVAGIFCELDTGAMPGMSQPCTAPLTFGALGSVAARMDYHFSVWAIDKAGNRSMTVSYDFSVDKQPAGSFDILGVTGGDDQKIDNFLGTVPTPTIHWSPSDRAVKYYLAVLDASASVEVCAQVELGLDTMYAYSPAACTLIDGVTYNVKMISEDGLGNQRATALFPFTVDLSGPTIKITGPALSNSDKNADFTFSVTDAVSGVQSSTCTMTSTVAGKTTTADTDCTSLTTIAFTDLQPGSYSFSIAAVDKAGNKSQSKPVEWNVNQIVCDPFGTADQSKVCVAGLRSNLYYLTAAQQQNPPSSVADLISIGTKSSTTILLSQLMVPTTSFSKGFTTTSGSVIRDDAGQTLFEWFALDIETTVLLDPAKNIEGTYQFSILSDDGAIVEIQDPTTGKWSELINNDGAHATRFGCDLSGYKMTKDTRLPMRVRYYQGPRVAIAVALLWRLMPTDPTLIKDKECGVSNGDSYYYGDISNNPPNYTDFAFGGLVKRGWQALTPKNFVIDVPAHQ